MVRRECRDRGAAAAFRRLPGQLLDMTCCQARSRHMPRPSVTYQWCRPSNCGTLCYRITSNTVKTQTRRRSGHYERRALALTGPRSHTSDRVAAGSVGRAGTVTPMTLPRRRVDWRAGLLDAPDGSAHLDQLASSLVDVTVERLDLGWSAGPRFRNEPPYRWLPYKEAYSPPLVRSILDSWTDLHGVVLDPFSGAGTTVQVAVERGLTAIGVETLEYPRWAANVSLDARRANADRLRGFARSGGRTERLKQSQLMSAPAASWALTTEVANALVNIREALPERGTDLEGDLAHLALLSVVDLVSSAVKDGSSLRRPRRSRARGAAEDKVAVVMRASDVRRLFNDALTNISDDLSKLAAPSTAAGVIGGDARHLPLADSTVGAAVFSPPYPNRYDYSAVYQLELALGQFVRTPDDLRRVRKGLLRSHLEAPAPESGAIDDPAVAEVLHAVAQASRGGEAGRLLRMLIGYFQDMQLMFDELHRVLRKGAPAACVVATQTYFGVAVPTDLLLASLAATSGFDVEKLWVLRRKGIPVQQRLRGEVNAAGSRESVIFFRKPAAI